MEMFKKSKKTLIKLKHYNDVICYVLAGIFGTVSAFLFGLIPGMIFMTFLWLTVGVLIDLPSDKGGGN